METSITWDRFPITIHHCKNWLNTGFDHIELKAEEPLPVTQTGYRSHFIHSNELAQFASVEDFVREWLDEAGQSKDWKKYLKDSQQLSLF